MAFYVVLLTQTNKVMGFLGTGEEPDPEFPMEFEDEAGANAAMKGHMMKNFYEVIEI